MARNYGDKAPKVAELAAFTGKRWPVKGKRLSQEFPYIEADIKWAVKEYACTVVDVLARRTSFAFLNVQTAEDVLPRIVEIMAQELGWSKKEKAVSFTHCHTVTLLILFIAGTNGIWLSVSTDNGAQGKN